MGTEGGRVGQIRVTGDQLKRDTSRLENGNDSFLDLLHVPS